MSPLASPAVSTAVAIVTNCARGPAHLHSARQKYTTEALLVEWCRYRPCNAAVVACCNGAVAASCNGAALGRGPGTVVVDALVSAVTGTVAVGTICVGTAVSIVIVGIVIGVLALSSSCCNTAPSPCPITVAVVTTVQKSSRCGKLNLRRVGLVLVKCSPVMVQSAQGVCLRPHSVKNNNSRSARSLQVGLESSIVAMVVCVGSAEPHG